ncbi:DoxX family protein [Micrococcoides hystricis]|uniref:DoxX family protein n=1 Tax=Micrococcoides hystricis TaxID=1572761 RepID=A0ABV6PBQ9_9MICC
MTLAQRLARPLLASSIIASGIKQLRAPEAAATSLEPVLAQAGQANPSLSLVTDNPDLVARVLGGIQVGSGALLALGKLPRFAAILLGATQSVTAAVEYLSAPADTEEEQEARNTTLLKNASIIGGVIYASVDRGGKPSLAWRAEHLAKDAQKQASKAIENLKK